MFFKGLAEKCIFLVNWQLNLTVYLTRETKTEKFYNKGNHIISQCVISCLNYLTISLKLPFSYICIFSFILK